MDVWTFADQYRAVVKSETTDSNERPILTGMALGLNSTLLISDGNTKLPPCPMLLLSNSDGLLQVYYFICKSLPPICRTYEVIKQISVVELTRNMFSEAPTQSSVSSSIPSTSHKPSTTESKVCFYLLV